MDRVFSFLLWPKREARGPWKQGRKKRGSITCRTDRANEANKMFIIWLCWLFRFWKSDRELEARTATYGPGIDQSQHAKSVSHIITYHILWINHFRGMLYWVIQARGWEIVRKVNICPRRSRGQMRGFEDNLEAEGLYKLNTTYHESGIHFMIQQ